MYLTILIDFLLATCILIFSLSLGSLLIQYKNDYQPLASLFEAEKSVGFNAVIRICVAPISIVVFSILLYLLNWNDAIKNIWLTSIYFLILQSLLYTFLNRWQLINKNKYIIFHFISIALSYYIYRTLITKGLHHLLPDEANLRTDMWLLIVGFFYGIFRLIPENDKKFQFRKKHYVKNRAAIFSKKYKNYISNYSPLFQDILLALMIYEDYNRPKIVRFFENTLNAKTRGIMQVRDASSDAESIIMAAKFLKEPFKKVTATKEGSPERYRAFYDLFRFFNPGDPNYSSEVMTIFQTLRDVTPIQQNSTSNYKKYRSLKTRD